MENHGTSSSISEDAGVYTSMEGQNVSYSLIENGANAKQKPENPAVIVEHH